MATPQDLQEPSGAGAACCSYGVPSVSHRRCVACGVFLGCPGELPAGRDWRLCADCEAEGKLVLIRGRRQRYWKPSDVAAELGLAPITILRAIRKGRLKAIHVPGHATKGPGSRYLIPDASLRAFLAGDRADARASVSSAQLESG